MRDRNPAPFQGPFPPLKPGEEHVFNIQDIRIRRRGGNSIEIDPKTNKKIFGLHFISFQNNIQQTGFEFINNIWLLNPLFRGVDHIMDPDKGIAEPVEGAYYFVPPAHRDYPGDVFFD
jgi:deferrochelatase/peroxidase EfeB